MFYAEFCEIFKYTFFIEDNRWLLLIHASVILYSNGFQYSADVFTGVFLWLLQIF